MIVIKLIIVRHGDPDYEHDTLTEKGQREAELLSERLSKLNVKAFYCSPLGRAKATAKPTLEKMGRTAEICPWLQEFEGKRADPVTGQILPFWDLLPAEWTKVELLSHPDGWKTEPTVAVGTAIEQYDRVCRGLDELMAHHGYVRQGHVYKVEQENRDTVVLFCHFGVECILLSHLLHISPFSLLHGFVALPTGVTMVCSEERRQGIASFRCNRFGDLSHLYAGQEEPSFSARFCENYSEPNERHE